MKERERRRVEGGKKTRTGKSEKKAEMAISGRETLAANGPVRLRQQQSQGSQKTDSRDFKRFRFLSE